MDIYTHVTMDSKREGAEALQAAMAAGLAALGQGATRRAAHSLAATSQPQSA